MLWSLWPVLSERLSAFLSLGISFRNFEKKIFLLQNMRKMTHLLFHNASILVSLAVFLMHRFETVGIFAHFLCVKNAITPSIWCSAFIFTFSNFTLQYQIEINYWIGFEQ